MSFSGVRGFLTLLLVSSIVPAGAQLRPFGEAHAIVGARIEVGDGRVIEKGTVLVRDGLIEAVGKDIPVPPDAEVLKGDGLIVYPGFIDAWSTKGLKLPDWKPDQDTLPDAAAEAYPSMREANRKWVRPELHAVDYFALTDSEAAPIRKTGFTAILAAPSGGIINGDAALVGLSGRPRREAVIAAEAVACMSCRMPDGGGFFGGNPTYPATLLGLFSDLRQTLDDARWYSRLSTAFTSGGPRRPPADSSLSALQPVLDGKLRVLMEAESEQEVGRALSLSHEMGLKFILCGANEAWKHARAIASDGLPVIVSLKLPDEPKLPGDKPKEDKPKDEKIEGEKPKDDKPADPGKSDKKPDEDPDEDLPLAARRENKRLWEEKLANAMLLQKAGVKLAFTTRGTKDGAEFWTNLRRVIKGGFPRDAALKALTIEPASMFGVDRQLGTVEAGKIANMTVMTADFTDEKAKARYLFIDGRKIDTEIEPPSQRPTGTAGGDATRKESGR